MCRYASYCDDVEFFSSRIKEGAWRTPRDTNDRNTNIFLLFIFKIHTKRRKRVIPKERTSERVRETDRC